MRHLWDKYFHWWTKTPTSLRGFRHLVRKIKKKCINLSRNSNRLPYRKKLVSRRTTRLDMRTGSFNVYKCLTGDEDKEEMKMEKNWYWTNCVVCCTWNWFFPKINIVLKQFALFLSLHYTLTPWFLFSVAAASTSNILFCNSSNLGYFHACIPGGRSFALIRGCISIWWILDCIRCTWSPRSHFIFVEITFIVNEPL